MIKVTYLEHSGFTLEYDEAVLVFDYYKGVLPEFDKTKKIYVFSSHAHDDHFQPVILEWMDKYPNTFYILSDDIVLDDEQKKKVDGNVRFVSPDETFVLDEVKIRTLGSTDEGVAFLVHIKEKTIYHAGDLNWWHWEGEDEEMWNQPMAAGYKKEIAKIEGEKIDIAFVVLDTRQGEQYYWGMDYFMKHTDTQKVFPMHMWGYEIWDKLMDNPVSEDYRGKVMHITGASQEFLCD